MLKQLPTWSNKLTPGRRGCFDIAVSSNRANITSTEAVAWAPRSESNAFSDTTAATYPSTCDSDWMYDRDFDLCTKMKLKGKEVDDINDDDDTNNIVRAELEDGFGSLKPSKR
jgi:hypothetical protein